MLDFWLVVGRVSLRRAYPSLSSSRLRCSDSMRCLRIVSRRESAPPTRLLVVGWKSSSSSSLSSSWRVGFLRGARERVDGVAIGLKRCAAIERGTAAAAEYIAGGECEPLPRLRRPSEDISPALRVYEGPSEGGEMPAPSGGVYGRVGGLKGAAMGMWLWRELKAVGLEGTK